MKQGFQIETPASLSEVESMGTNESRESMGAMEWIRHTYSNDSIVPLFPGDQKIS